LPPHADPIIPCELGDCEIREGGKSSGGLKLPQSQLNIIVGPACMMPAEINATGRQDFVE
jgi:hypothetical protein